MKIVGSSQVDYYDSYFRSMRDELIWDRSSSTPSTPDYLLPFEDVIRQYNHMYRLPSYFVFFVHICGKSYPVMATYLPTGTKVHHYSFSDLPAPFAEWKPFYRDSFHTFFDTALNVSEELRTARWPIVLQRETYINVNANLSEIDFYKKIDMVQLYQEIAMFIANPSPIQTKIKDEDLLVSKGFNKWTFRTPKDKRKRKKRSTK